MTDAEEKDQKFKVLLKGIEGNNKRFFLDVANLYDVYQIKKEKAGYRIVIINRFPAHIHNMIEAAFLEAYKF